MLSSPYFPRAYFGALMLRRTVAVVVPPIVVPADLVDALRQIRAGLDKLEQLLLKKA